MFNENPEQYWAEAAYLPFDVVLEWCQKDPENFKARKHAVISACHKDRIKYSHDCDGSIDRDFELYIHECRGIPDWVEFLISKKELLIERVSFQEWVDSLGEKRSAEMHLGCNPQHPFYANKLKIAIDAWIELYEKNPPNGKPIGGHIKYILDFLEKEHPDLSGNAREEIAKTINPNPKGGA